MALPLSILDLSPIASGSSSSQALRNTIDLACLADRLGYTRYWLAEHHNMPGVAISAPEIVIGHVASATKRIRVGSGGIILAVSAVCADTNEKAAEPASSMDLSFLRLRTGRPGLLPSPEEARAYPCTAMERAQVESYRSRRTVGDPATAEVQLRGLAADCCTPAIIASPTHMRS